MSGRARRARSRYRPADRPGQGHLEARQIAAGQDLESGEPDRILVGRTLARKLGLRPGDGSRFRRHKGGGINTLSYEVKGTTSTIIAAIDNVSVSMDLRDASELLGTDTVPQLTVFLKSTADTGRVLEGCGPSPQTAPRPAPGPTRACMPPPA